MTPPAPSSPEAPAPRALVLGGFDPPTAGQVRALAALAPDGLAVGVVARAGDRDPAHGRAEWLRERLPAAAVAVVRPGDALPAAGAVWTTEPEALPDGPAAAPLAFDGPTSDAVRVDPMRHWDALPAPARSAYVRRVRLFGPESTGKSTAAAALAARFGTVWVPEMSRPLYEAAGYRFTFDDVARVVVAQLEAEETAARAARRVLVCDTDPLTTLVYARHYFGRAPAFLAPLADTRRYAATLLFNLDVPWEPDPCRDSPEARAHLFALMRAALDERGTPYAVIGGTGAARLDAAARAIEAMLAAPEPD